MVIFKKVKAKNFFSIGNQPIEIYLDKSPTTLITGSNGAGKSSAILDTVYFGLFGKPFRNINKPNIVNSINNSDLEVELDFTVNKRSYKIIRGMKPNKFEIYEGDRLVDQSAAVRDYQKHLEENILGGLNEKVFKQVVIIGSADYKPFMQLKASDRREVIEELLDIKIFSQMLEIAKANKAVLREELRDLEYSVKLTDEKINMQTASKARRDADNEAKKELLQDNIEKEKKKIEDKKAEIVEIEDKKAVYIQKLTGHDVLIKSINDIQKLLSQLTTTKTSNSKTIAFFDENDTCPTCKQDISADHKHDILETTHSKIEEVDEAIKRVKDELAKKKANLEIYEKIKDAVSKCEKEIYKRETDIKSHERFISQMKTEIISLDNPQEFDDDITELEEEREKYANQRQECSASMSYYDVVSNMLRDGGIKTKIIRQYVPIMNKIINDYLVRFGLPIEFSLDENFNEVIKSRHRDSFQYNNFSEGEKQRIDTALLLAWRQIAKSKNTTNTNLLIMDETFDSSLDAVATEELLNLLLEMDSKTNIFIISHKHDLSDKLRSHIQFEKKGNFTTVSSMPE